MSKKTESKAPSNIELLTEIRDLLRPLATLAQHDIEKIQQQARQADLDRRVKELGVSMLKEQLKNEQEGKEDKKDDTSK